MTAPTTTRPVEARGPTPERIREHEKLVEDRSLMRQKLLEVEHSDKTVPVEVSAPAFVGRMKYDFKAHGATETYQGRVIYEGMQACRELARTGENPAYSKAADRLSEEPELAVYHTFIENNLLQLAGLTPSERELPGPAPAREGTVVSPPMPATPGWYRREPRTGKREPTPEELRKAARDFEEVKAPTTKALTAEEITPEMRQMMRGMEDGIKQDEAVRQQRRDTEEELRREGQLTQERHERAVEAEAKRRAKARTRELQEDLPDELKPGSLWERAKRLGRGARGWLMGKTAEPEPEPGQQTELGFMGAGGMVKAYNIEPRDHDLVVEARESFPDGLDQYVTNADRKRTAFASRHELGVEQTKDHQPIYIDMRRVRLLQQKADTERPVEAEVVEEGRPEDRPLMEQFIRSENAAMRRALGERLLRELRGEDRKPTLTERAGAGRAAIRMERSESSRKETNSKREALIGVIKNSGMQREDELDAMKRAASLQPERLDEVIDKYGRWAKVARERKAI